MTTTKPMPHQEPKSAEAKNLGGRPKGPNKRRIFADLEETALAYLDAEAQREGRSRAGQIAHILKLRYAGSDVAIPPKVLEELRQSADNIKAAF